MSGPVTWDLLLPTMPHRHDQMCELLAEIHRQWQPGLGVLVYRDNMRRPGNASYGKWQDLQEMSQAEYTSFISDDDWIAPDFVFRIMEALQDRPDYVGFPVRYTFDGKLMTPVEHSLRHDGWHDSPSLLSRDIVHYNPIRRDLALLATWQADHFGADRTWAAELRATGKVETEAWIPGQMYYYRETSNSWSRWGGRNPGPLPEPQIEPLPQYPWLTAVDECAPPPDPGLAFAGDGLLEKEIRRLISQYGIQSAVETGTYQGATTRALAAMVPEVHTVEISPASFAQSRRRLDGVPNVRQYCGATPDVLPRLLPQVRKPALYYLDAHWNGSYPLPREVEIIAAHDPQPVIVMHDMQVPGHPELHADPRPDGSPYCFEWVRPSLEKIAMPWRHYYNERAEGLQVGVLFVTPDGEG